MLTTFVYCVSLAYFSPFEDGELKFLQIKHNESNVNVNVRLFVGDGGTITHPGNLILPGAIVDGLPLHIENTLSTLRLSQTYTTWGICQTRVYFGFIPSMCSSEKTVQFECTDWSDVDWIDITLEHHMFNGSCENTNGVNIDCSKYTYGNKTIINPLKEGYAMFVDNNTCILYEPQTSSDRVVPLVYSAVILFYYMQYTYITSTITASIVKGDASTQWTQFIARSLGFNEVTTFVVFSKVWELMFGPWNEKYLPVVEYTLGSEAANRYYSYFVVYTVIISTFNGVILFAQQLPYRSARIDKYIDNNGDALYVLFSMTLGLMYIYNLVQFAGVGFFSVTNVELINVLIGAWILYELGKYFILVCFTGSSLHVLCACVSIVAFFLYSTLFMLMSLIVGPYLMSRNQPWQLILASIGLTMMIIGSKSTLSLIKRFKQTLKQQ